METIKYRKQRTLHLLSILAIITGILLLVYMIVVEDEPGAIPLMLITLGFGGFLITRFKSR